MCLFLIGCATPEDSARLGRVFKAVADIGANQSAQAQQRIVAGQQSVQPAYNSYSSQQAPQYTCEQNCQIKGHSYGVCYQTCKDLLK